MPRRSLKLKKTLKVDTRVSPEEDAKLERLAIELEMSKSEVMRLGLTEEGRHRLEQAEERIKALGPNMRLKEADLTSPANRARARRSDKYLGDKETEKSRERDAKLATARGMLEACRRFYDIEAATGLSRAEVTELENERQEANRRSTRAALDSMEDRLKQSPGVSPPDELADRIRALREEDDPEPSFPTLNNPWRYRGGEKSIL
jgi:hypothetical protein